MSRSRTAFQQLRLRARSRSSPSATASPSPRESRHREYRYRRRPKPAKSASAWSKSIRTAAWPIASSISPGPTARSLLRQIERHRIRRPALRTPGQLRALRQSLPARRPRDARCKTAAARSGLWGHAISGDLPIVLLQIADPANIDLVRQLVQAHAYWRLKDSPSISSSGTKTKPATASNCRNRSSA